MQSREKSFNNSIWLIVWSEFSERWSFYGMKGVLAIFLTTFLLDANGMLDTLSDPEAQEWIHLFLGAAYITPLLGSILADVVWGKYRTIMFLSSFYVIGHLTIAFDETQRGLMIGMGLIALGAGGLKPCISTFLGDQLPKNAGDIAREKVFTLFYILINIGAALAYLSSQRLLENEWLIEKGLNVTITFGFPAILMVVSVALLWYGNYRKMYHLQPPSKWEVFRNALIKNGEGLLKRVVPIYIFAAAFWALFDQTASSVVLMVNSPLMDKMLLGIEIDPTQSQAFNPILIVMLTPIFSAALFPWLRKFLPMNQVQRIALGFILAALSFGLLTFVQSQLDAGLEMSIAWILLMYVVLTAAEIFVSISLLDLGYAVAPKELKSLVMSLYALSVALGNVFVAGVNHYMIEEIPQVRIEAGAQTYLHVDAYELEEKDVIYFTGISGVKTTEESPLTGKFRVFEESESKYRLEDISGNEVESQGVFQANRNEDYPFIVSRPSLQGKYYFLFFTVLMGLVAILFPLVYRKQVTEKVE